MAEVGKLFALILTSFAIKIVMTGSNPSYPPRITDLRAIALAK